MGIRELKQSANAALKAQPNVKQLALLHTGVSIAASLILSLAQYLTANAMQGLSGIGSLDRMATLQMIPVILQFLLTTLAPFWSFGILQVALQTSRGETPRADSLLAGFRSWGPLLRYMILMTITCFALMMACTWGISTVYMMTPFGMMLQEKMLPMMEQAQTDPAAMETLAMAMIKELWPVYLLATLGSLVLIGLYFYRIRLAPYLIMEGEKRARYAIAKSRIAMHGHRLWWFKLDLSFWWYYGLQALAVALSYGNYLFGNSDLAFWIFYILSLLAQLAIAWQFVGKVETAYAVAYQRLKPQPPEETNTL